MPSLYLLLTLSPISNAPRRAANELWTKFALAACYRVGVLGCTSGSRGGCGPITLVRAR
jgi:hypothetical protein